MTTEPKTKYKPINVTIEDWEIYNQIAIALSAQRQKRIPLHRLIREAVASYAQILENTNK